MMYIRNMAFLHSCVPRSIPFTVDGATKSYTAVFYPRWIRRVSIQESPLDATVSPPPPSL